MHYSVLFCHIKLPWSTLQFLIAIGFNVNKLRMPLLTAFFNGMLAIVLQKSKIIIYRPVNSVVRNHLTGYLENEHISCNDWKGAAVQTILMHLSNVFLLIRNKAINFPELSAIWFQRIFFLPCLNAVINRDYGTHSQTVSTQRDSRCLLLFVYRNSHRSACGKSKKRRQKKKAALGKENWFLEAVDIFP